MFIILALNDLGERRAYGPYSDRPSAEAEMAEKRHWDSMSKDCSAQMFRWFVVPLAQKRVAS